MVFEETAVINDEGAVVIPAEIREELNLQSGTQFCVEMEGKEIRLTQRAHRSRLVRKNGYWVVPVQNNAPLQYGVDEAREERIQELLERN